MPYTGKSLRKFEDHRLLTGASSYVDDLWLPGLLHALALRSPHAKINAIDAAAASRLPGVVAVFTANDFAGIIENLPTRTNTGADHASTRFVQGSFVFKIGDRAFGKWR